jgi:hypothetical protein
MSEQQFFVSKGRSIRGPVTDRKKVTVNGKVSFVGTSGKVYHSHNEAGEPVALPRGFVEWLKSTKDTNGQSKLQNMLESGYIVLEAGASTPLEFAKPLSVNLLAAGGVVSEDPKGGK